uniref:Uncharacterized protein n=1 Tax=Anguilla anguilla TaxID=7936 RepID=A0A0E9SU10_ANGAN
MGHAAPPRRNFTGWHTCHPNVCPTIIFQIIFTLKSPLVLSNIMKSKQKFPGDVKSLFVCNISASFENAQGTSLGCHFVTCHWQ